MVSKEQGASFTSRGSKLEASRRLSPSSSLLATTKSLVRAMILVSAAVLAEALAVRPDLFKSAVLMI